MMISLCKTYWQFILAQGVCVSIGNSLIFFVCLNSALTWFTTKRATALGLVVTGSSLGGVIWPVFFARLFSTIGFAWTMRAAGFMVLGCLVFANLFVDTYLPPRGTEGSPWIDVTVFTDMRCFTYTAGGVIILLGLFVPFAYIPQFGMELGLSEDMSIYAISILNATSVLGRTVPSILADRVVGKFNTIIITTFLSGLFILAWSLPLKSTSAFLGFVALYGFSSGSFVSLMNPCLAQISDIRSIGVRTGTGMGVLSLGAIAGIPITGQIITVQNGSRSGASIFSGVCVIAGSVGMVVSRFLQDKRLIAKV